jgi:hypothetical protein
MIFMALLNKIGKPVDNSDMINSYYEIYGPFE